MGAVAPAPPRHVVARAPRVGQPDVRGNESGGGDHLAAQAQPDPGSPRGRAVLPVAIWQRRPVAVLLHGILRGNGPRALLVIPGRRAPIRSTRIAHGRGFREVPPGPTPAVT